MRIVHVINYFQPKLGYQETFLPREQARLGQDTYVVTSDRFSPLVYNANKDLLGERIKGVGFFEEEGIKVWRLKTLFVPPHNIWILGLENKVKELKPDVVHVYGISSLAALRIARLKKKIGGFKLVYTDGTTFANSRGKLRILYPLFKAAFSQLIQEASDAFVAILPESKILIHERHGIPLERITIIPLGADDELFKLDPQARNEIRSQYSIDENEAVFIYAGKILPQKGLPLLIQAVKLLQRHGNLRVLLVGSGYKNYVEELKQDIKAKELGGRFLWHDAVPNRELSRFYSAADVAVWPREASIGMREAMACQLPIIISEASTVTELVEYNNGFTYRDGDIPHLAQQMERLLDPELRREMGSNSRRVIEERLSWRIIARQYIELV